MRRHEESQCVLIREVGGEGRGKGGKGGKEGSVLGNGCRRVGICESDGLQQRGIGEAGRLA
jgi:hypothetical protein